MEKIVTPGPLSKFPMTDVHGTGTVYLPTKFGGFFMVHVPAPSKGCQ